MLGFSADEIERLAELKRIKSDSVSQISEYWRRNMEADNNKRSNGRCSPLFWQWAVGSERAHLYKKAGKDGQKIAGHASEGMTRNYQRDYK